MTTRHKAEHADTTEQPDSPAAAETGSTPHSSDAGAPPSLEEQLAAKTREAGENWDRFLRERADLENYRKRVNREKEELLNYGTKSMIDEILPVIDNLERALAHASEDGSGALLEGVRMTHVMLLNALKKFGVSPLETTGVPFDPAFHQAMTQVPTDEHPPNTVIEEYQKGYMLKERLLRPAMVAVAAPLK